MLTKKQSMSITPRFVLTSLFFALTLLFTTSLSAQDAAGGEGAADGIPTDAGLVSAGESLFKANCTQCHAIQE